MSDDEPKIYVPPDDDDAANVVEQMKGNACTLLPGYDPWFGDAREAVAWEPPDGFDSERA